MPWTETTTTVENEKKFINYAREQMSQDKLLELTIVVNGVAVGMADLHNIDWENRRAEVGYWLFSKYQGKGIMTATVKSLLRTAFNGWNLNKVIIQADSENQASQAVAKRLGFKQEAVLKEHLYQKQQFSDLVVYAKFASEWKNE
jgi:ribosomal-protein-serine acetyltransferase